MPENTDPQPKKSATKPPDLETAAKFVAGLTTLAYATGVITINIYLHQLGITDFSFAKPKLLLTGILVLSTYLLLAAPLFFLFSKLFGRRIAGWSDLPRVRDLAPPVGAFLLLLIIASGYFCFGEEPAMGQETVWWIHEQMGKADMLTQCVETVMVAGGIYLPILLAAFCGFHAVAILNPATPRTRRRISFESFHLALALLFLLLSTLVFVYFFALTFYPAVPQAFGGGQPYFESFAVEPSAQCTLEALGIEFEAGRPHVTFPLPVLHESDVLVAVWFRIGSASDGGSNAKGAAAQSGEGSESAKAPVEETSSRVTDQDASIPLPARRFVVQIDKKEIDGTMEYPFPKTWEPTKWPPAPCKDSAAAASSK
jgi:hypothetical protein